MSYREDLKAYIDGELSPERAEEVRDAIESDPHLQSEFNELKGMTSLFSAVKQPQPYGMEDTLLALEAAKRPRRRAIAWPWWMGIGLAGAGALVMLIGNPSNNIESTTEAPYTVTMREQSGADSNMAGANEIDNTLDSAMRALEDKHVEPEDRTQRPETAKRKDPATGSIKPRDHKKPAAAGSSQGLASADVRRTEKRPSKPLAGAINPDKIAEKPAAAIMATQPPLEIEVSSLPDAEIELARLLEENGGSIKPPPANLQHKGEATAEVAPPDRKEIILEIPEDRVVTTLALLKELEERVQRRALQDNAFARGGSGAGGGLGGGAFGNNQRAAPPATAANPKGPTKTVKIVLVKKKPSESPPPEEIPPMKEIVFNLSLFFSA